MSVTFNLTGIGTAQHLTVPDGGTLTGTVSTSGGPPAGPQPNGPNPSLYRLTADWNFTNMSTLPIVDASGNIPDTNHWKVFGGFGHAPYIDGTSPYWVTPGINVGNPFQLDSTVGLRMISKGEPDGSYSGAFLQGFNNTAHFDGTGNGFKQTGGYWQATMRLPPQNDGSVWGAFWANTVGDGQYFSEIDWEFGYDEVQHFFYLSAGFIRWAEAGGQNSESVQYVQGATLAGLSTGFHTFGWEIIVATSVINFWLDGSLFVSYTAPPEMLTDLGMLLDLTQNSAVSAGPHEFDIQRISVWQHV